MKKILLSCLVMALTLCTSAQMMVDNGQTVQTWVEDGLVGQGVEAFNVMVNGMPGNMIHLQVGGFTDANGDIGLTEGFIMGTGSVLMAEQPNTGGGSTLAGAGNNYSFPPLEDLTSFSVNDQCVVEFDFIPQGDSLEFKYVFASEEYEEYVCGSVNDVFGFFLSGPDPDGGVYINQNLALIPDPSDPMDQYIFTTTPVSINTLNPGVVGANGTESNCSDADPDWADYNVFYTPNTTNTYEYDGSSVELTARAGVVCGQVYHITLAVGDGGDTAFDSAVFLKGGSLQAQPTGLDAMAVDSLGQEIEAGLVEISAACDSGFTSIRRPCASDTIYYQLNYLVNDSTAEYGVDYEPMPFDTVMYIGETELFIPINTIPDGIVEDTEYICIELSESAFEDGPFNVIDTVCLAIRDNYTFPVIVEDIRLYCPESVPSFTAFPIDPGFAPYTYEWFLNGSTVSTENPFEPIIPAQWDSLIYDLQVIDYCGAFSDPVSPYVINLIPSYPEIEVTSTGEYCPGIDYELTASRSGGTAPHTYIWTDEFGMSYDDAQSIFVDPASIYGPIDQLTYKVVYEDNCDPTRTDSAEIVVIFPDPLEVEAFMNSSICTDQILEIETTSSGGYPPYTYTWTSNPALGPTPDFPIQFGFLQGDNGSANASGFLADAMADQYLINLNLDDWCSLQSSIFLSAMDTDTVTSINCIYPNVVSPNGDGSNDSFLVNELINRPGTMFIYNRWGNLLAETNDNEWTISDEPDGTYYYVVQFDDEEEDKERKGYFTIVR